MLVSVIIPTYNRAKTIQRAVDSVLAQTWKELEVIVVDDGSTDQTESVLKAYGDKIHVIHQKNAGPSAARNTGIRAAKGEIIAFLDSDDVWLPLKIERQAKLLQSTESLGVVCCLCNSRMLYSSQTKTSFQISQLQPEIAEGVWDNPVDFLITHFILFNQAVAIRREALFQAGLFREDLPFGLNDDYDLSLRLSLIGPWTFIVDPLVEWYEHPGNISSTHRQLEICTVTFQILNDINNSPDFRPKLPQNLVKRQLRSLSRSICALRMKNHTNPLARLLGSVLLGYCRVNKAFFSRILPAPQIMIRDIKR